MGAFGSEIETIVSWAEKTIWITKEGAKHIKWVHLKEKKKNA